jgi:hypothetical protein
VPTATLLSAVLSTGGSGDSVPIENPQRDAEQVVQGIRAECPDEARLLDEASLREGLELVPYEWLERFSQLTTDAIRLGRLDRAGHHLAVVSELLERGGESTRRVIDVAYVEPLMWDIRDERTKRTGWRLFPPSLRALYVSIWGEQPFMQSQ